MARKRKVSTFTASEYLEEHGRARQTRTVLVPISIAAAALGVKPTTARAYVRAGKLDEVEIDCGEQTVKGVTMGSVAKVLHERDEAIEHIVDELETLLYGSGGRVQTYGEVMPHLLMSTNNPHDRAMIGRALGRLSRLSLRNHDFLISAIVVLQQSGRPNDSFFELAEELKVKRKSQSNEAFWQSQMAKIRDHFGPQEWDE